MKSGIFSRIALFRGFFRVFHFLDQVDHMKVASIWTETPPPQKPHFRVKKTPKIELQKPVKKGIFESFFQSY